MDSSSSSSEEEENDESEGEEEPTTTNVSDSKSKSVEKPITSHGESMEKAKAKTEPETVPKAILSVPNIPPPEASALAPISTNTVVRPTSNDMKTRYYKVTTFKHLNCSEIKKREIIHRIRQESLEEDEEEKENASNNSEEEEDEDTFDEQGSPPCLPTMTGTKILRPRRPTTLLPPLAQIPVFRSTNPNAKSHLPYNRRRATFSLEPLNSSHHRNNPNYNVPKRYSVSLGGSPVLDWSNSGTLSHTSSNAQHNFTVNNDNANGRVSVNVTLHSPSRSSASCSSSSSHLANYSTDRVPSSYSNISNSSNPPPHCHHPTRPNFLPIPKSCKANSNNNNNNSKSLTYSTSCNSPDGYRSQLQIQIGPNGGTTISASRRKNQKSNAKNENSSIEQMTKG